MNQVCAAAPGVNDPDGLTAALLLLEQRFRQSIATVPGGVVSYRSCGGETGPAIVLLHGIGSGGASWLHCALALEQHARVIAWDAPGYGGSTALDNTAPSAADYAARLEELLAALGIEECLLVGHSLGAITAAAYANAAESGKRVRQLVLISPAQGYGAPEKRERAAQVAAERLNTLASLGVLGMAEQRSARTVSSQAGPAARAWARWNMSRLHTGGYTQAVHMLCGDDIRNYLPPAMPGAVFCGSLDTVTTPVDSRALAAEYNFPFGLIDDAGHACYIEQAAVVADGIRNIYFRTFKTL
jgi:pimeloyl-ACP methyl ester carboxylesterase